MKTYDCLNCEHSTSKNNGNLYCTLINKEVLCHMLCPEHSDIANDFPNFYENMEYMDLGFDITDGTISERDWKIKQMEELEYEFEE